MNILLALKTLERHRSMVRACSFATKMTEEWVPQLTALTPVGGCYMNEVSDLIQNNKSNEGSFLSKLMPCHVNQRPLSMSQVGSKRSMAPTTTSSALSRPNMTRLISSTRQLLLVASIGRLRWTDGSAGRDISIWCGHDTSRAVTVLKLRFVPPCCEASQQQ